MLPGAELGMDQLGGRGLRQAGRLAGGADLGRAWAVSLEDLVALRVGQPLELRAAVEAPSVGMIPRMTHAAKALERAADVVLAALEGLARRRAQARSCA
jgi:hypothetical protein